MSSASKPQKSRRADAYQQILLAIVLGDLEAGSRIDEMQIVRDFKLGHAAVRDALFRLSLEGLVEHAVSPRGTLALAASSRARALLRGRDHALPEDVEALAADTLAHRLIPSWRATSEGLSARDIVARLRAHVRPW